MNAYQIPAVVTRDTIRVTFRPSEDVQTLVYKRGFSVLPSEWNYRTAMSMLRFLRAIKDLTASEKVSIASFDMAIEKSFDDAEVEFGKLRDEAIRSCVARYNFGSLDMLTAEIWMEKRNRGEILEVFCGITPYVVESVSIEAHFEIADDGSVSHSYRSDRDADGSYNRNTVLPTLEDAIAHAKKVATMLVAKRVISVNVGYFAARKSLINANVDLTEVQAA